MKTADLIRIVAAIVLAITATSSFAQDKPVTEPPELIAKRDDLNRAVQRATAPLLMNYLRSLEPLKQQFTREGKLDAALAIDNEIRTTTEQLKKAQAIASGAKIAERGYVLVYPAEHYKGKAYRLEAPNEYPELMSAGVPNDSIQSMKIPEGFVVTLFDSNLFKGEGRRFTGDTPTLGEMKSVASSMRIEVKKP